MKQTKSTKTYKPADCGIKWHLVDATDCVVGRLAAELANIIRGKHKACYSPSQDCGDYVVVINADKVVLTGKKMESKKYYRHTGYIGGIKEKAAADQMNEHPERILYKAVERMVSRGSLGRDQMTKLRVFAGADHAHKAQNPTVLDLAGKNAKNKRGA